MKVRFLLASAAAMLLCGAFCGCGGEPAPKPPESIDFEGPAREAVPQLMDHDPFEKVIMETLTHSTKAEARKIHQTESIDADGQINEIETLGPIVPVKPEVAARLAAALQDPHSYYAEVLAGCFQPGVQFDFLKDDSRVTVRICFHCQNLTASCRKGKEAVAASPEILFSPGYARLARLAKEAFPDDKEIQAIDENAGLKFEPAASPSTKK